MRDARLGTGLKLTTYALFWRNGCAAQHNATERMRDIGRPTIRSSFPPRAEWIFLFHDNLLFENELLTGASSRKGSIDQS
jgi:hypothetical protein